VTQSWEGRISIYDLQNLTRIATNAKLSSGERQLFLDPQKLDQMVLQVFGNFETGDVLRWLQMPGLETTREVQGLLNFDGPAAISDDRRSLFLGGVDGTLSRWDLQSASSISSRFGSSITALLSLPNERLLIGDRDGDILLWDYRESKILGHLEGHTGEVRGIHSLLLPGGSKIVSGALDGTIRIWNLNRFRTGSVDSERCRARQIVILPGASQALLVPKDPWGVLEVWDLACGRRCERLSGGPLEDDNAAYGEVAALSSNGRYALTRMTGPSDGERFVLFDLEAKCVTWSSAPHAPTAHTVRLARDGRFALFAFHGDRGGGASLVDLTSNKELHSWNGLVSNPALADDGSLVAVTDESGCIELWDVAQREAIWTSAPGEKRARKAYIAPDVNWFITLEDDTVRFRSIRSGLPERVFRGAGWVWATAVSKDGRFMISSSGKSVQLWYLSTGKPVADFVTDRPIETVAISDDGMIVAGSDGAGGVHIFRVDAIRAILRSLGV
jgi:WD40 repeat protein